MRAAGGAGAGECIRHNPSYIAYFGLLCPPFVNHSHSYCASCTDGFSIMPNFLQFPDGILTLAAILGALLALSQLAHWLLPDSDEPVDEIREGREKR